MSMFGSAVKFIFKQDPTLREVMRMKEALDEHKKNEANWNDEERKMAEEATSWLRTYEDKVTE